MAKHYLNRNRKSPRFGKRFTIGAGGSHIYVDRKTGKVTKVGGKKKPEFDPTAPLRGAAFDREVEAATRLRYGDLDRGYASDLRVSDQAKSNTDKAWSDYLAMVGRANQQTAAAYQQASGQVYGQVQGAAAQNEAQRQALQGQMQQQNQNVGVQGPSQVEGLALQAAQARQASGNAQGALVTSQGATQQAFGQEQSRIGAGIRALELGKEDARKRLVLSKQRALEADKGDYRVSQRAALRGSEREWLAAQRAFSLNAQNTLQDNSLAVERARLDRADKAARRKLTKRGQNVTLRGQDLTDARAREKAAKDKSGGGKDGSRVPRSEASKNHRSFNKYVNTIRKKQVVSRGDATLVAAAKEWFRNERSGRRGVSAKTAKILLRDYGFRLPVVKAKKVNVKKLLW